MKLFKISHEEKSIQYSYLIILWITFSFVFIQISFNDSTPEEIRGLKIITEEINEKEEEAHEQKLNKNHFDTLRLLLSQYNHENNKSHLESSILYELNEIKKPYEQKNKKIHYHIYSQINFFYSILFYDKKATWNTIDNTIFLKNNLSECEIGFQQNQNNITLQEAFQLNNLKEEE